MPLRSGESEEEDWAKGFETYAGLESDAVPSRAAAVRGPGFRPVRGLATAVTLLLALAAAAAVHGLVADIDAFRHAGGPSPAGGYDARAFRLLDEVRDRHGTASSLQLWAMAATAGVFIAWFHRVRTNADALHPRACSTGAGWAIGVWFVPLVNLVMPWLIAREVTCASGRPAREGAARHEDVARTASLTLLNAWWAAWVASKALLVIGSRLPAADDEMALTHGTSGVWIGIDALNLVAAVLAILHVQQLTRLQQRGHARVTAPAAPRGD
ncbi:DUF4328 domain-containing protein [Streptomyces sp. ERV7]|uniref:DUF4328 domain-containing protein n=1 Tax=Streptomyces sp. ERV7 TaxID=1322334 RepID=UPI00131CF4B8|nr:DUF4328 domain-containing protein [Streptomyces sp. ERV7]